MKPVIARTRAVGDVEEAVAYYLQEADATVALAFIDAVERAYRDIAENPASGSPRYGHELGLPGLRHRRVTRFPFLVFFVERDDHVDVWRVLHAARDIPDWLRES